MLSLVFSVILASDYGLKPIIRERYIAEVKFMYEDRVPLFQEGTVKWFDPFKGYGFIERRDDSDIFVHYNDIIVKQDEFRRLYDGQEVRFRVGIGPRGEYAYNVFPSSSWFIYDKEK